MGTSEGNEADFGGLDELLHYRCVSTVDVLENILRQPDLVEDFDYLLYHARSLWGTFEDNSVSREDSGDKGVDEDKVGVVPGKDDEHHTDGFFTNESLEPRL